MSWRSLSAPVHVVTIGPGELEPTFSALSCVFGFLLLMRFLSERIASLGCTVLERMTSEISRLRAISSLHMDRRWSAQGSVASSERGTGASYRLLLVAFSICSSRALLAPDDHHPNILIAKVSNRDRRGSRVVGQGCGSWGH